MNDVEFKQVVESVIERLEQNNIKPLHKSVTTDGSFMLFHEGDFNTCVDVYREGALIVVLMSDKFTEAHTLTHDDKDRMIEIIKSKKP